MAAPGIDSRIIHPPMHSLFHFALVQTAVPLFNDFDFETLKRAFREIQQGNAADFNEGGQENCNINTAKEKLLFIPAHLRCRVMKAVTGLHRAVSQWESDHSAICYLTDKKCTFYWRPDGTIDRTKTAEQLVLNANIHIREKFDIACMYCLVKSVQALWPVMEASDETENIVTADNPMKRFWVRWIREGSRVPWLEAAEEYLEPPREHGLDPWPRYSSFLPLLRPEVKKRFLSSLKWSRCEDFRFCLYSATKEEEEQILKIGVKWLLLDCLDWTLQSFFLETAKKVWNFINVDDYHLLVNTIWFYMERRGFEFCELFVVFWNRSPKHLLESAKGNSLLRQKFCSCFNEIKRRRGKNS